MEKKKRDEYKELLHSVGLKATSDRLQILKVLERKNRPMSVRDIAQKTPRTDLVTIYRFLDILKEKGIVRQVNISDERKYFEIAITSHHHHIVCEKCGYLEKVDKCSLDEIFNRQLHTSESFVQITDHHFEIFGVCKKCA